MATLMAQHHGATEDRWDSKVIGGVIDVHNKMTGQETRFLSISDGLPMLCQKEATSQQALAMNLKVLSLD